MIARKAASRYIGNASRCASNLNRQSFFLLLFATSLGGSAFLSLRGTPDFRGLGLPPMVTRFLGTHDFCNNLAAFFVVALTAEAARGRRCSRRPLFLSVAALVVLLELLQFLRPQRHPDLRDVLAGWLGIGLAAIMVGARERHRSAANAPCSDERTRLRVIVWGINYAPELTGIAPYNAALCDYLRNQGHAAEMVTTFAYYPAWRKNAEDRARLFRTDHLDGVPVHRCWHYVPERVSAAKRIVHEASFVTLSFLRLLVLPRPDVMVVVSPPLLLGAAARILGALKQTPFIFHVQDLQPDAALSLGMLKPGRLARALYRLEKLAYRAAARVSGISVGMLEAFASKGVPEQKRVYFPNPVVLPELSALPRLGEFRRRHSFATADFLAIYSGNLGSKQGLGVLLEAAAQLRDPRVKIIICGDGAERETLAASVARSCVSNVLLLPLQEQSHYEEMLVDADVCLITQQKGSGRAFFPSKLLNALAFARPVLTVADEESELARALTEGGFGANVLPNQPEMLAQKLAALAARPSELVRMAERGRIYVRQFSADVVFASFERCLQVVAAERAR